MVWTTPATRAEIVEEVKRSPIPGDREGIDKSSPRTPTSWPMQTKPQALGWFVGQVMKATGGKANPQAVNELLKKKLGL
jgi:aspartyl-tRNA(Asn)/glutamyl-tRNA(Gln) amidotransferase subunit B